MSAATDGDSRATIEVKEKRRRSPLLARELAVGRFRWSTCCTARRDRIWHCNAKVEETGRKRYGQRYWCGRSLHLAGVNGTLSPPGPFTAWQVVEYLEVLIEEPCRRTVPETVVKSISYMERAGDVHEALRPSCMTMKRRTLEFMTAELSVGAPPRKTAVLFPRSWQSAWS